MANSALPVLGHEVSRIFRVTCETDSIIFVRTKTDSMIFVRINQFVSSARNLGTSAHALPSAFGRGSVDCRRCYTHNLFYKFRNSEVENLYPFTCKEFCGKLKN